MANRDAIVLGGGTLYIDDVDVGHLFGPVTVHIERQGLTLPPDHAGFDEPTGYRTRETMVLRATAAELCAEHLRLALGLASASAETITGAPSYNPASFAPATDSTSYDVLHLGRAAVDTTSFGVRFEHVTAAGKTVAVILYKAMASAWLDLAFSGDMFTMAGVEFHAICDDDRPENERLGQILFEA